MTTRALVLGGGGPLGIAWEAGLLAGLAEGGLALDAADSIVGTSAGSFVGARLALGESPAAIAEPFLTDAPPPHARRYRRPKGAGSSSADLMFLFERMLQAADGVRPADQLARELGERALAADTIDEEQFLGFFTADLGTDRWPERSYRCTAFDAVDGSFIVWQADSGVPLGRAVASSCAVPGLFPPVTIEGRRYFDGGVLSATNAHLAVGHDIVVVLAVTTTVVPPGELATRMRQPLEGELAALRDGGARVELVELDEPSTAIYAANPMDYTRQAEAGRAGHTQAEVELERLRTVWD
jgi:NTE family protein